jgi:tetratricopeptide (TPR) repeat protein
MGLSYIQLKEYDKALITFNEILMDFPEYPDQERVDLYIAIVHFYRNEGKKSFKILDKLKNSKVSDLAYYYQGIFYERSGENGKAAENLNYLIKNFIGSEKWDDGNRELAYLYKDIGRFDLEKATIVQYLKKSPNGKYRNELKFLLGVVFYDNDNYEKGLKQFTFLYKNFYRMEQTAYYIGECYFYTKKFKEGIRFYEEAISLRTDYLNSAYKSLFFSYYNLGDHKNCLRILSEIRSKSIKINDLDYYFAMVYFEKKDYDTTLTYLNNLFKSVENDNILEKGLIMYGNCFNNIGKAKKAIDFLVKKSDKTNSYKIDELIGDLYFNGENFVASAEYYNKGLLNVNITSEKKEVLTVKLAKTYYFLNRYTDASDILKNFSDRVKNDEYLLIYGKILYKLGDYQGAKHYLNDISEESKLFREANRFIGWSLHNQGHLFDAIDHWGELLEKSKQRDMSYYRIKFDIGKVYYEMKNYQMALPILLDIYNNSNDGFLKNDIEYYLAKVYYKLEKYNESADYFSKLENDKNYGEEAKFYVAWCYLGLKKYDIAIEKFKVISGDSGNSYRYDALLKIGDIYYNTKKYQKAADTFDAITKRDDIDEKQRGWAAYNYEWTLFKMGKYQSSIDVSDNFLKKYPNSPIAPQIQLNKGKFYYSKENFKKARDEFQRLLLQYSNSNEALEAKYYIGLCLLKMKKIDKAYVYFDELNKDPSSEKWGTLALFKLTSILVLEEKYRKAAVNYKKLLDMDIEQSIYENVLFNLGIVYKKLRQYDNAKRYFEKLAETTKDIDLKGETLLKLGEIYQIMGLYKRVEEVYSYVIVNGTKQAQVEGEYWLGEFLFNQREYDRAIEEFMKIVYLYKEFTMWANSARFKIVDCYLKKNDKKNAKKMLQLIIEKTYNTDSVKKAKEMLKKL